MFGVVRGVQVWLGCSGPVLDCFLSGRGDFGCSGLVRFVQVCSAVFGVFGAGVGLLPIWSGRFRVVGSGQICSGLFGCVRGVRGRCRAASYLVGVIFAWSGLVRFVRGVRGGWRWAWVGPLCCWGGATVSRCGWDGALGAVRGEMPAALFRHSRVLFRRPKLDLGPIRRLLAARATGRSCERALGLGPKSSLGRRILGAGVGGRAGQIPARGRE